MDPPSHDTSEVSDPKDGRTTPELKVPPDTKSTPRRCTVTQIDPNRVDNQDTRKRHAEDMSGTFIISKEESFMTLVPGEDPTPEQLAEFPEIKLDYAKLESVSYPILARDMQASLNCSGKFVARITATFPDNGNLTEQSFNGPQLATGVLSTTKVDDEGSDAQISGSGSQAKPSCLRTQKNSKDSGQGSDEQPASQTAAVEKPKDLRLEKKVDLCIYDAIFDESEQRLISRSDLNPTERAKKRRNTGNEDLYARTAWHQIVVPIEVKKQGESNPFTVLNVSEGNSVDNDNIGGEIIRGQMTEYLSTILLSQHRTHIFSIYIHGPMVYLMRWDRAGAVVCTPFSLEKDSHKLHRFLYRLGTMSRSERGYDETVKPASPEQAQAFKDFVTENPYLKKYKDEALDPKWPLYTVTLPGFGKDAPAELHLVFGKPRFTSRCLVGRATRGYIAFDLDHKRLVFLKDYWRPGRKGAHSELDVYKDLIKHDVSYIATPIGGGDVVSGTETQKTKTHLFPIKSVDPRVHYRFAVKEIGRPIEEYETPQEMVIVITQALCAHSSAWADAHVLHRDVSCGNILIDVDPQNPQVQNGKRVPQGFLNDWDMCKYKNELDKPTHANRSGTWLFMSSLLLNFPKKPHQLSDDLESFVHILIWLTIRFQTHWPGTVELWCVVLAYEDATRTSDGFDVGSSAKLDNMRRGEPGFNLEHIHVPPLAKLIENLVQMCKQHHASLDWEKDLKPYTSVDTAKAFEDMYEWSAKNKRADMGAEADLAVNVVGLKPEFKFKSRRKDAEKEERQKDSEEKRKRRQKEEEETPKPAMNDHEEIFRLFAAAAESSDWYHADSTKQPDSLSKIGRPSNTLTCPGGSGSVPKRGLPEEVPENGEGDKDKDSKARKGVKRQRMNGPSTAGKGLEPVQEEV